MNIDALKRPLHPHLFDLICAMPEMFGGCTFITESSLFVHDRKLRREIISLRDREVRVVFLEDSIPNVYLSGEGLKRIYPWPDDERRQDEEEFIVGGDVNGVTHIILDAAAQCVVGGVYTGMYSLGEEKPTLQNLGNLACSRPTLSKQRVADVMRRFPHRIEGRLAIVKRPNSVRTVFIQRCLPAANTFLGLVCEENKLTVKSNVLTIPIPVQDHPQKDWEIISLQQLQGETPEDLFRSLDFKPAQ